MSALAALPDTGGRRDLAALAGRVGTGAAGPHADEVDRDARFPIEALDAMREARLLGALVPAELGGGGSTISELAAAVETLSRYCASSGMVLAMHVGQLHCVVRHGDTPALRDFLRAVATNELLLASATTEINIGGDTRSSGCAVMRHEGRFEVDKQAPVISYGAYADAILVTARAGPDSPPSDQVLALCRRDTTTLTQTGEWQTLGFRGTCSPGYVLHGEGSEDEILPVPFADISAETMLPTSHIVWSSVWLGIATAAVSLARRYVRAEARKSSGSVPPAAPRLADLVARLQELADLVHSSARRYEAALEDRDQLESLGFAIAMNGLKLSSSRAVIEIVTQAMSICGIAAYREDTEYRMGRLLRDAHGAPLMINNDRIIGNNAHMLLVHKGD